MSGRELERVRSRALQAIEQLKQEEAEANARGDAESAGLYRSQWQYLEQRFAPRVAEIEADSAKMTREKLIKWTALARAHRATGKPRPSLLDVAEMMGWTSEQPLRDYCRELGIKNWHDVHPIVAAFRENL